jgi:uncharacterized protein YjcR
MDLNINDIASYFAERKTKLMKLEGVVSKKFFQIMADKIFLEEKSAMDILLERDNKKTAMNRYSLILNPNYFEQEFLRK